MPTTTNRVCCVIGLLWFAGGSRAVEWHSPDAPCRFRIQRGEGETYASPVGVFRLWTTDIAADAARIPIFSESGTPVPSQVLWTAEGEPAQVLFDSSGAEKAYYAYPGAPSGGQPVVGADTNSPPWQPEAGLILETRRHDGVPVESWDQCLKAWSRAGPVYGRSLAPRIFDGLHRHGPTENIFSCYKGWFEVPKPDAYVFATISTDASFLAVDGRLVAQWPGTHPLHKGRFGQFRGTIDLKAGRHFLEYYNAYGSAKANQPLVCVTAWQPGTNALMNIMPVEAFVPVAHYWVAGMDGAPVGVQTNSLSGATNAPTAHLPLKPCFEWNVLQHSIISRDRPDEGLVTMEFRARKTHGNTSFQWIFDDSSTGQGQKITNVFPRCGLRTVRLNLVANGRVVAALDQKARARPNWLQREDFLPDIFEKQKANLLTRDLALLPLDDLISLTRLATNYRDHELLARVAPLALARSGDFKPQELDLLLGLGLEMGTHPHRSYELSERLLSAIVAWKPAAANLDASDSKRLAETREKARLLLAALFIQCKDQPRDGLRMLEQIAAAQLGKDEQRWKTIFEGDAHLALGDVETAKKIYLTITDPPKREDTKAMIRRMARLDMARYFLDQKEYDEAERLLQEIEWEAPMERMSPDNGLLRVKLHRARQEAARALALCRRLLNVPSSDTAESLLLFQLAELCNEQNQREESEAAVKKLLTKHPYSEAAALAKEKWGDRVIPKK
ncbi:MAG: hypothetical protein HY360_09565 [Verrucomicrobia bacterium]|nr:hypothetical protein [Verrucomicrobiota bacterium]